MRSALCLLLILIFNSFTVHSADSCVSVFATFNIPDKPRTVGPFVEKDHWREWGVQILKDNDPAYQDPNYKKAVLWASKLGTVSFYSHGPLSSEFSRLYSAYKRHFERTDSYGPEILRFTNSGTEANNMLYEFAEYAFHQRTGKKAQRANLLYFGNPYGGTFGRIAEIGVRYQTDPAIAARLQIPTPHTRRFSAHSPEEAARLDLIEKEALSFIRKQVQNDDLEIGGIFLEPITTTKGLHMFRPQFLAELRKLADELNVPIMADEIFTGGGRTGEFWAVAHYGDFRPDLFTFGKGLGVSGVASFSSYKVVKDQRQLKWRWPSYENTEHQKDGLYTYPDAVLDNTSRVHPLALVQSLKIITRVLDDNLTEHAKREGAEALALMKEKAKRLGFEDEIFGIGLLFDLGSHTPELLRSVSHYNGRLSPPITVTADDFTILLSEAVR